MFYFFIACNCSPSGSKATKSLYECDNTGQCKCKPHYSGRTCDSCGCNPKGSDSQQCYENGKCKHCKSNFIAGDKCDGCADGRINFPNCITGNFVT